MKPSKSVWLWGLLVMAVGTSGWSTNYYVVGSGQSAPNPPWTNWGQAHTNLIEVVAGARNGDMIFVTNGNTYILTNEVLIAYAVTVRSWNAVGQLDPATTILNGNYPNTTNRCLNLSNYYARVMGFTITNGCVLTNAIGGLNSGSGGGVFLTRGHLTNCIITGNRSYDPKISSSYGGGGIYMGTPGSGSVWNCAIIGNTSSNGGGGIMINAAGPWVVANCTIAGNVTTNASNGGGLKVYNASGGATVQDCQIVSNLDNGVGSGGFGGGVFMVVYGLLSRCVIAGNTSSNSGGGICISGAVTVRNCVIYNNNCTNAGSRGGGVHFATSGGLIQNCTIYSNVASSGGGISFAAGSTGYVENCVIWTNRSTAGGAASNNYVLMSGTAAAYFTNSCTTPDVNAYGTNCIATNCIAGDPLFADLSTNNCRLSSGSPCIDAGINRFWMTADTDKDGRPRMNYFRQQVDMGAYEYAPRGSIYLVY